MDAEQFAALIAGIESRGISRTEIAVGARISRTTVWRLATGEARAPSFETITRLIRYEEKIALVSPMKQKMA